MTYDVYEKFRFFPFFIEQNPVINSVIIYDLISYLLKYIYVQK